jgi:hypothetical protein
VRRRRPNCSPRCRLAWIRAVSASLLLLTDAGAGRAPLARWRRSLLVRHCSLGVDVDALAPAPRAVTAGASFSNSSQVRSRRVARHRRDVGCRRACRLAVGDCARALVSRVADGNAGRMRLSVPCEGVECVLTERHLGSKDRARGARPSWPRRKAPGGGTQSRLGLLLSCMRRWEGMASDAS